MILIIPLRNNGPFDQLRFALRSITTHHSIETCILVGGKPSWYTGTHIPHKDYGPVFKEANIRDKVLVGAQYLCGNVIGSPTSFMMANDDHILLAPLTKVYNKGLLSTCLSTRQGNGSYTRCLRNTFEHYGDVLNIDTHCPMIMDSEGVKKTNFEWPAYGIGFKTCYATENGVDSEYYPDCKVSTLPTNRLWFSMEDSFNMHEIVALFPQNSIFES